MQVIDLKSIQNLNSAPPSEIIGDISMRRSRMSDASKIENRPVMSLLYGTVTAN